MNYALLVDATLSEHNTNEEEEALTKFHSVWTQWQTLRADGSQRYAYRQPTGLSAAQHNTKKAYPPLDWQSLKI